jgi:Flp pilus assembly protein TadG
MRKSWRFGLRQAQEGTSTIEFAIVVSALATLTMGAIDFGIGFWEQMQVGDAARAGAEYATKNGFNSSNIQNAITSATGLSSITASPAPTQSCGCPNVTSGIVAATCGAACTSGGTAGTYVTANATASYTTLFPWPVIPNPVNLTASVMVRTN